MFASPRETANPPEAAVKVRAFAAASVAEMFIDPPGRDGARGRTQDPGCRHAQRGGHQNGRLRFS